MQILVIGAGDVDLRLGHRLAREQHDITMVEANAQNVARPSANRRACGAWQRRAN